MSAIVEAILTWWGGVVVAVSAYLLIVAVLNIIYFLGIRRGSDKRTGARVSVLIPARNEEDTIAECLDGLLEQTYENYEVIILDDGSTDRTPGILESYEKRHERVRVIQGREKPDGWKGKTFAVQQLAEEATGEYLYIVDADTTHDPEAVSWAVSRLEDRNLDAFSAMARQLGSSFADKLFVPMVYLPLTFVPVQIFNSPRVRSLSFGIGQFFMFRRNSFFSLGGMEPVREEITEDLALSRELKGRGYRYQFFTSRSHVSCRMYGSVKGSIKGYNKNLYDIAASAPLLVACLTPLIVLIFTLPVLVLAANLVAAIFATGWSINIVLAAGVALFLFSWVLHLLSHRQPACIVLLAPLFFAFLSGLLYSALHRYRKGRKPVWKSRKVDSSDTTG